MKLLKQLWFTLKVKVWKDIAELANDIHGYQLNHD